MTQAKYFRSAALEAKFFRQMDTSYVELLVADHPKKPHNLVELSEMVSLLESLAMNEQSQPPAVARFIETLTALIMQYEQDIEPDQERSPIGVLRYLMEERNMRQLDLVPLLGGKSYVSQIFSGHRPISKDSAAKLAELFYVAPHVFL